MNLPAAGERPIAVEELEKTAPVFVNVLSGIFVKAGQVERGLRHRADAAQSRGESISEAVLFQRRANQSAHAVALAPVEPGILERVNGRGARCSRVGVRPL